LAGLGAGVDQAKAQSPQITISGTAGQGPLSKALFNHDKHQNAVSDCGVCHHAPKDDPQPCTQCHTSAGDPKGNNLQLSDVMHNPTSERSCVGCHQAQTKKPDCAGCHHNIAPGPRKTNCVVCHTDAAAQTCQIAVPAAPKSVTMGELSKFYEPSTVFDHAAHLGYLKDRIAGAKGTTDLTKAFHLNDAALCAGCHHHTPVGQVPPKCGACHGKTEQDGRPGLKAAYHNLCNQCHKAMNAGAPAATDCTACHAPKK